MKANYILPLLLLTSISCFSQEKFDTYDNFYTEKTYDIRIASKETNKFTLYIDVWSIDRLHSEGGIMVNEKQYPAFLDALSDAKLKYQEWSKTAKDNNVKEVDKEMTIQSNVDGFFYYGDWNFDFNIALKYEFRVIDKKGVPQYLLVIKTGELQSSSNQFMKVDGLVLVFSSIEELDDFAYKITGDKINAYLNKPKASDLFKN